MFFSNKAFSENYDKVLYDFKIESITGEVIDLKKFQNKVVLITNTASYCGFTKQYSDLQKLWQKYESISNFYKYIQKSMQLQKLWQIKAVYLWV